MVVQSREKLVKVEMNSTLSLSMLLNGMSPIEVSYLCVLGEVAKAFINPAVDPLP